MLIGFHEVVSKTKPINMCVTQVYVVDVIVLLTIIREYCKLFCADCLHIYPNNDALICTEEYIYNYIELFGFCLMLLDFNQKSRRK